MKHLIFLTILLQGFLTSAQNWQLINSTDTTFFGTYDSSMDKYHLKNSMVDSIKIDNADSVFYFFKTLGWVDFQDTMSNLYGVRTINSWLGEKVIIKSNGKHIFFNEKNDSILINPYHHLNDIDTIWKQNNQGLNEYILGEVISESEETILGNTDSVKTIKFTCSNTGLYLHNQEIKFSKHFGLISFYPFNHFAISTEPKYELMGRKQPIRLGLTGPTFADIFDLEIGDIIKYSSSGSPYSFSLFKMTILSKDQFNIDSVNYQILYQEEYHFTGSPDNNTPHTTLYTDTIFRKYQNNQNYYNPSIIDKHQSHILNLDFEDSCGYSVSNRNWFFYDPGNTYFLEQTNTYYYTTWHASDNTSYAYSNAFNLYYDSNSVNWSGGIYFASKVYSGYTCGPSIFYLSAPELESHHLKVFPNPTNKWLKFGRMVSNIQIYNVNGSLVYSKPDNLNQIDISNLNNGMYFLIFTDENNTIHSSKIIKE
ncbi:MAG: T9SS type A sorting domain-containing protein [Putridiphycobacter sp.]